MPCCVQMPCCVGNVLKAPPAASMNTGNNLRRKQRICAVITLPSARPGWLLVRAAAGRFEAGHIAAQRNRSLQDKWIACDPLRGARAFIHLVVLPDEDDLGQPSASTRVVVDRERGGLCRIAHRLSRRAPGRASGGIRSLSSIGRVRIECNGVLRTVQGTAIMRGENRACRTCLRTGVEPLSPSCRP